MRSLLKYTHQAALLCLMFFVTLKISAQDYKAAKTATPPVIDGVGDDDCWKGTPWYDINYLWLGTQPSVVDFNGRFKVSWDADRIYVLGEIVDDSLSDTHEDPLSNYWEDDCFEVFVDEDNSGGDHTNDYNAFLYHISTTYDAVDIGIDENPHLYNDHISILRSKKGNLYTWELSLKVYTADFDIEATNNQLATLETGKVMGFGLAYCDNDGGASRESFLGSMDIPGSNKNVHWQDASVFGKLELVNFIEPTFNHILVNGGFQAPSAMEFLPDGRILVAEQGGNLKIIKNGQVLSEPLLTVPANYGGGFSERGLIGLTADPDFINNQYIYIYYTTEDGKLHNRVSRFTMNGDTASLSSELIVLDLDTLSSATNHHGGFMKFGPDGKLYIAAGENASPNLSQNLDSYLGKLLRINKDGTAPSDNPYTSGSDQKRRIWAYGLRNPFSFDFQPGTGKLYVNDVGLDDWEEINDASEGGKNFGWPEAEGFSNNPSFDNPFYAYGHENTDSTGCAITAGLFFNPASTNYPVDYIGQYFFMDYCNNWINYIDPETKVRKTMSVEIPGAPVAMKIGTDGNIYYLSRTNAAVYKIIYTGNPELSIIENPKDASADVAESTSFKVSVAGAGPFSFQWFKNDVAMEGEVNPILTINNIQFSDSGYYKVRVIQEEEILFSDSAKLSVFPFNAKPVAEIITPENGIFYSGGEEFTFSGMATDEEDGELPASAFTWYVDFYHDDHVHDGPATAIGAKSGSFVIPRTGETSTNVWFKIKLIVSDSRGKKDTAYAELYPRVSSFSLESNPQGLPLTLDGHMLQTPYTSEAVVGTERLIRAPLYQRMEDDFFQFNGWNIQGDITQVVTIPENDQDYIANYSLLELNNSIVTGIHDAYVKDGTENSKDARTKYGVEDSLHLISRTSSAGNSYVYLKFPIDNLPDTLFQVDLMLWGHLKDEGAPIEIEALPSFEASWTETGISWFIQPGVSSPRISSILVKDTSASFHKWPVTEWIKTQIPSGKSEVTFVLKNTGNDSNSVIFNSKEADKNPPVLSVYYPEALGVSDQNTNSINVYPNPANRSAVIKYSSDRSEDLEINIIDEYGKVLLRKSTYSKVGQNQHHLKLTEFLPGVYYIQLKGNKKIECVKLMVF